MERLGENRTNLYNLNNYFGFDEKDTDLLSWDKSSILNETNATFEFQPNKPYRLALYVRPSEQKSLHGKKAILLKGSVEKQLKNKQTESENKSRLQGKDIKRSKDVAKKVMLFDENVQPESISKKTKKALETTKCEKSVTIKEPPLSIRKNILREVNSKCFSKTKQNKIRRSYEKKFKEKESENILEPPSEEIIKEMEFKKLSRSKPKKTVKEDKEFEKWANSMNSAFDDVEKFELSITYD